MKKKILFAILFAIFILPRMIDGVDAFTLRFITPPEEVLQRFYTEKDLAEDQLEDVLILAGTKMIPLLEEEIVNPKMKRRLYAIGALGTIGNEKSILLLESILQNKKEHESYRGEALLSITRIDASYGKKIAPQYETEGDFLADCVKHILSEEKNSWVGGRTYWDAFRHAHY